MKVSLPPRGVPGARSAAAVTGVLLLVAGLAASGTAARGDEGLARLRAGNARFVADPAAARSLGPGSRTAPAAGDAPFAAVVSCADSRVPPETIFQAGPGELFVVRAAGHVADRAVLASIEYAAEHLGVPLIVVMGHELCAAVKTVSEMPETTTHGPNLEYLVKAIQPAVARTAGQPAAARLRAAILANVEETINDLVTKSTTLRQRAAAGRVTIVGAYYELTSGSVHFSEPVFVPSINAVASH